MLCSLLLFNNKNLRIVINRKTFHSCIYISLVRSKEKHPLSVENILFKLNIILDDNLRRYLCWCGVNRGDDEYGEEYRPRDGDHVSPPHDCPVSTILIN